MRMISSFFSSSPVVSNSRIASSMFWIVPRMRNTSRVSANTGKTTVLDSASGISGMYLGAMSSGVFSAVAKKRSINLAIVLADQAYMTTSSRLNRMCSKTTRKLGCPGNRW